MKRDDTSLNKLLVTARLQPLMSNIKWVKLLTIMVENAGLIKECRVKLVWEEGAAERTLVFDEHTSYNFDYYDTAMEAMITGLPRGWYAYKEIEWLDFPRFIGNGTAQDIKHIQQKLMQVGQFQWALIEDNLRLYAYQRLLTM